VSSSPLTARETLALLARLKTLVAQIAEAEVRSLSELQKRRVAMERKYRDAAFRARTAEETFAETDARQWAEYEERMHAHQAARRVRIQALYRQSLRKLDTLAQRKKEKFLGDLQMRHFRAERQKPKETKQLEKEYALVAAELGGHQAKIAELIKRAGRALSGVSSLRAYFETPAPVDLDSAPPLAEHVQALEENVVALEQIRLVRALRYAQPPYLYTAAALFGVAIAFLVGDVTGAIAGGALALVVYGLVFIVQHTATGQARDLAAALAPGLTLAKANVEQSLLDAAAAHEEKLAALEQRFAEEYAEIEGQWGNGDEVARKFVVKQREKLEAQVLRLMRRNEQFLEPRLAGAQVAQQARRDEVIARAEAERTQREAAQVSENAVLSEEENTRWTPIETRWREEVLPVYHEVLAALGVSTGKGPATLAEVEQWRPPAEFASSIQFGQLVLDVAQPANAYPRDPRLQLPGPTRLELPLALVFPEQGSLLFETKDSGERTVIDTLNNVILRFLSRVPAGKLTVTLIDPVGLGENFAGLMTLGDYEESLINRRIWTQREQIDERLAELNEHIEKMIQMYLRDEFATISEYNAKAGSVAEKYHLLVVADFPAGFSDTAAKRIQSIASSGPRCGVFTLIHWDTRHLQPDGLVPEEMRKRAVTIRREGAAYVMNPKENPAGVALVLDPPPEPAVAAALVHKIGKSSIDSNRVEVPFSQISPPASELWHSDTTQELRVPIGRTGATKLQYLSIGKGTRQHALFAGKTGSGKSTLFLVIITNLALWCSPEQVEFYLIDFKKGVEFKCYASRRLPHARVIAIESDREFALSVLQRVDEELRRRGDLFRALGVQDVAGYKRSGGTEPMPRSLLIIDEFQEFFVEDDTTAQNAALLFDRIVRQGRAFGIHVLLGSQTHGGAYTLARATLGQMAIRVALQCNEADAYLIMDDNNSAPRLLSRPGEGIYNDAAGAVEGNSPFQVVWISDEERDRRLDEIHAEADRRQLAVRTPIVFEGNAPAAVRENDLLREVLAAPALQAPAAGRAWLGAPNAIKGPTEVRFRRQSGNHLLIVGQREESAITLLALSLIALGAQYPRGAARFYFFATAPADSSELAFLERAVQAVPHDVNFVRGGDVSAAMSELATELKARSAAGEGNLDAPATFVVIPGLQRFKKLKYEDDFSFSSSGDEGGGNPGAQLNEIITEGASHGIHLIVAVDTFGNVQRWLNRKAIAEFEFRVLFQMSANDSASLIDSPQASNLGLYRALLYNEQEGTLETFRPYALPDNEWMEQAVARVAGAAVVSGA
jgi:hypothetical protein